ncbi:MAG: PQQ-dependent sugar dehydrogenase, partial [Chitinophagales bacterium]
VLFYSLKSSSQNVVLQLESFSTGYPNALDVESCGDGRLFIVEKTGYIYECDSAGNKNSTPFLDIHTMVKTVSERGLLGLAFSPDYFNNRYFFIYYSQINTDSNVIVRYRVDSLNPDKADPNSGQIIFRISHPNYDNHDGGCLRFGKDGYLYAGTGDGGSAWDPANNAQNRKRYLGKLLRLDVNVDSGYVVPADNPFVNDTSFYPEIWALGLRNPWRYCYDRLTNDLWIADVGQGTWEEIDYITATDTGGQDYGWDCYEGFAANEVAHCDSAGDLTWPIYVYQHLGSDCAITGGFVYRGALFKNLYGKYIFNDYCSGKFRTLSKDANGNWVEHDVGNFTDNNFVSYGEDRYGELYAAGLVDGIIYHVTDTACAPVAQILIDNGNGNLFIDSAACENWTLQTPSNPLLQYQWQVNGNEIPGATSNAINPSDTGSYTVVVTKGSSCSSVSTSVEVTAVPVSIAGADSVYCVFQGPDTLSGNPGGGVFSGDGIVDNVFYPDSAGVGQHTITYSYSYQDNCESSTQVTLTVDPCTGINQLWNENGFNIFPNPSSGDFKILFNDMNTSHTTISISNVAGQEIFRKDYSSSEIKNNLIELHFELLANGVYTIKIIDGNSSSVSKIMISH